MPFRACSVGRDTRYHPDRDGVLKQGFAGEGLTPPELREMLRRLFQIKLTEPELSAVFAHFVPDGGMELDGNVFIIHFIQVTVKMGMYLFRRLSLLSRRCCSTLLGMATMHTKKHVYFVKITMKSSIGTPELRRSCPQWWRGHNP